MKEKLEIKNCYLILSVFGLALLLLLSPCKVRNFIQAELDFPQTNVLNKSRTTISATSCVAFDIAEINHSSSTSDTKAQDFLYNNELFAFHFPTRLKVYNTFRIRASKRVPSIPLYILYQNIQVYS
ncbi:Hypothetical membrane protein [Zobellia galactanivorans]|uniref:Hypothetical membrane protein n=1 Tax=Zobellia galactanivorans (strain DSM 12802 / CCUG 47099 / CIP 106680 / NCIMB 13871 / Dsij) TaxID=63186 RepID=G0L0J6_ZOBGA|nr:Hypothetical membrane protein [Zobellia galactanivorans]